MVRKRLESSHPLRHLDPILIGTIILLASLGALLVYSATSHVSNPSPFRFLRLQLLWIIIGLIAFGLTASFDYHKLKTYTPIIFAGSVVTLMAVLIIGRTALGAQRWIAIGPFTFQPSEFAKIGLIITLAAFLSGKKEGLAPPRNVLVALLYTFILLLLVFIQPDLGTALVFMAIALGMLFASGINLRYIVGTIAIGILALPISIHLHILKDYQIERLLTFLNPAGDPAGAGYSLIQSKIAIGSGQLTGRGLFLGSQTRLNFIPASHTDFIFAVLGEEIGFLGAAILITLFGILLWRVIEVARTSRDLFGALLVVGVLSMLIFQIFVNIGMTIGIMPITGIPLPLISYGGSSFLATMIGLGLVMNVYMRRYGGKVEL
jgi:rod shape determining protein RodA